MATLNKKNNIIAKCPGCDGALSTYLRTSTDGLMTLSYVSVHEKTISGRSGPYKTSSTALGHIYQLYRCSSCGRGALGVIRTSRRGTQNTSWLDLTSFMPESGETLPIPSDVPIGIQKEFREAEKCLAAGCNRAAAAMFRSVLDKAMKDNGYNPKGNRALKAQIELAAKEKILTEARAKRAQDGRELGNDILHDEWMHIGEEAVSKAHHYAQRILEDLYDDRETVLAMLKTANRLKQKGADSGDPASPTEP